MWARSQSVGVVQEYSRLFADEAQSNVYGLLGTWSIATRRGWTVYASRRRQTIFGA